MQHGSIGPHPHQVGSAADIHYAQQQRATQEKAAAYASAQNNALGAKQYACETAEPRMLDALTRMLREVRNRTNMAVTNLDGFLGRATGECTLTPSTPAPAAVGPVQSPLHEAAELLGEITHALNALENIQSRVDRIA